VFKGLNETNPISVSMPLETYRDKCVESQAAYKYLVAMCRTFRAFAWRGGGGTRNTEENK